MLKNPHIAVSVTGRAVTNPAVVAGGNESIAPVIVFDMVAIANAAAPVVAIATYAPNCDCRLFVCSVMSTHELVNMNANG
jgi:hypothetical protein